MPPRPISVSVFALKTFSSLAFSSIAKKSDSGMAIASRIRLSALTDGLIRSLSIRDTVALPTPAFLASARWESPARWRAIFSLSPVVMSMVFTVFSIVSGWGRLWADYRKLRLWQISSCSG